MALIKLVRSVLSRVTSTPCSNRKSKPSPDRNWVVKENMAAGGMLEEGSNEGMLVRMEDLKARNIVADENTDPIQCLMIVLGVAVEKLEEKEKKRKSLLAEKALKKPIVFGVNLQDEVNRQQRHFTDLTSVDDDKKKNTGIHPVNEAKLVYSAARSYNRGAACDGVDDYSSWLTLRTGRGDDNEEFQRQQPKKPASSDDHRQAGSVVFKKGGTGFTWEKFAGSAMKSYVWTNNFDPNNRFKSTAVKNIDEELMMKQQKSINARRNGGLKRKLSSSSEDSFEVKKDQKLKKKKKKTGTPLNTEDVEKALPDPPPGPLPQKFQDKIREMQGENPVLVIQKRLFRTDVSDSHCRLSIPENKVVTPGFLTEEEKEDILVNTRAGYIIEPSLRVRTIYFKRWKMEKETGKTSYTYALKTPWNEVRCDNGLRLHHIVQVWAFRVQGKVAFALVKFDEGAAASHHQEAEPQYNGGDNTNGTEGGTGPSQIDKLEGEHGSIGMDAAGAAAAAGTESHPSIGGTEDGQQSGSASNNRSDEDGQSHNTDFRESQQSQSDHKQDQALKWMV